MWSPETPNTQVRTLCEPTTYVDNFATRTTPSVRPHVSPDIPTQTQMKPTGDDGTLSNFD